MTGRRYALSRRLPVIVSALKRRGGQHGIGGSQYEGSGLVIRRIGNDRNIEHDPKRNLFTNPDE